MLQFCRQLRHRCVRDLAFSLYSESLLLHLHECPATPYTLEFNAQVKHWLSRLDQQPALLWDHLAKRTSTRLGLYFESLWSFYWQHAGQGRLLSQGQQLTRNGRTLGALDFVIESTTGELMHIEAAVKFFLGRPKTDASSSSTAAAHSIWQSDAFDWIGPNANDSLANKLEHMRRHQLPLSSSRESRKAVAQISGTEAPVTQRFLLRGCLFWPALTHAAEFASARRSEGAALGTSGDINPRANAGLWWHLSEFLQLNSLANCEHFTLLPRNHWLAPACYSGALLPLSLSALKQALVQQIMQRKQGFMVVGLSHEDNQWYETQRLFVVPDQWPDNL